MPTLTLEDKLEALLDSEGFGAVVSALETICREKSAHVADVWGDKELSKVWRGRANRLDKVVSADPMPTV